MSTITESELVTKTYLDHRLNELEFRFTTKLYGALFVHGLAMAGAIIAAAGVL